MLVNGKVEIMVGNEEEGKVMVGSVDGEEMAETILDTTTPDSED